jgi:hypothetical protein
MNVTERNGKAIAMLDLSGLSPQAIIELIPRFNDFVLDARSARVLVDISDTFTTAEIKAAVAASSQTLRDRLGKVNFALVGVRGLQRVIANAANAGQYFAKDREDGLAHLASI